MKFPSSTNLFATALQIALAFTTSLARAAYPLPSWNDGVAKKSLVDFVAKVTTAKHPKTGRLFTEMVYQPMLELLAYLRANGFKTFIVSGGVLASVPSVRPLVRLRRLSGASRRASKANIAIPWPRSVNTLGRRTGRSATREGPERHGRSHRLQLWRCARDHDDPRREARSVDAAVASFNGEWRLRARLPTR